MTSKESKLTTFKVNTLIRLAILVYKSVYNSGFFKVTNEIIEKLIIVNIDNLLDANTIKAYNTWLH